MDEILTGNSTENSMESVMEDLAGKIVPIDVEYEMKRANYWATVGCGAVGYYQR